MADYRVGMGHGLSLENLYPIEPEPKIPGGLQYTQRTYGISGRPHHLGPFCVLEWDFQEDEVEYATMLTQFGLSQVTLFSSVTVYIRDPIFGMGLYEGMAILPEPGKDVRWDNYFLRNLKMTLKNLEKIG